MAGIVVRDMSVDDVPIVFRIGSREFDAERNIYHGFWSLAELCRHLDSEKELSIVAELDGSVVGFALGQKSFSSYQRDLGYFDWIAVSGEHQKKGVGTALCAEIISRFSKIGVNRIIVDTNVEESRNLLAGFNFKKAFTADWLIRDVS